MTRFVPALLCLCLLLPPVVAEEPARPIKILFLGDNGHHRPVERFRQLQPVLAARNIDLTYTDKPEALNPKALAGYDGIILYANTTHITPEEESSLLDFVEGGKGFIPLHCASYCFLNSPKYVAMVGAQFKSHRTGTFRTIIAEPDHPVMKGFAGFESWDETYIHTRHNEKDRTILEYREENGVKEPWTWVRTQGKGRVFYTAWGHDERTWSNPGFQNLVERGVCWAVGQDPSAVPAFQGPSARTATANPFDRTFTIPEMTPKRTDVKPFEYDDVGPKIPNYTPGQVWGRQGEPFNLMQRPLPAEESLKHAIVPKGFHVELFADERLLGGGKPICMTWDTRGRLWVALTTDYPHDLQAPGRGHDRIVILEDTDGDGKADKVTTFAEKLSIPTSIMFYHDGVLVFDAGQTVFLKDTDGDGKADVRQVVHDGWSLRDTHGEVSNMQYGLDNWVWAMQGYNDSQVTVGGQTHRFRQGFFRFKPDGSALEFVRSTDNNTWGLGLSEEGIVFGSTANRNPSVYMPIPNRYYEAVRGWAPSLVLRMISDTHMFKAVTDKVRQVDHHGGYTAGAGASLYTARAYPPEYWDRVGFVSDPTGHLTGAFVYRREGADFRSTNAFNLFASDDEWTSPVMAEVGPDGNVWVIDWYSYIVQHNPTPAGFRTGRGAAYQTDLRDKQHGRIYRVVHDANKTPARGPVSLDGAAPQQLVETLKNDNLFWRRHAQRLLVERGQKDVLPALMALVRDQATDTIGLNAGAMHALWTMHGLGALDGSNPEATGVAVVALRHPSAGVRRNAVQVLPHTSESTAALLAAGLLEDSDAQVRLMSFLALADLPATPAAAKSIVTAMADPQNSGDAWIPDAATCAAAKNADQFLIALSAQPRPAGRLLSIAAIVAEHYARGGGSPAFADVMSSLAAGDVSVADTVVRAFAVGWVRGPAPRLDARLEESLDRLAGRLAPERRGLVVKLATGWGSKRFEKYMAEAADALLAKVKDENAAADQRATAARELIGYRADRETVQTLLDLIGPRCPPELAAGVLGAVRESDVAPAGGLILERLSGFTPLARKAGIAALLTRPDWTRGLLEAIDKGSVPVADLTLEQKQALAAHPDPRLRSHAVAALRRGDALPNADRQKVIDEMIGVTKQKGDAAAGKLVFKNTCSKCHVHGGEGERIGPDLTGMAVHPKEHLLTEILDPSRSVEANFRVYTVTTIKGQVLTGLLASESRTAVELVDAEGKRSSLLREEIAELTGSNKSLMPDGFEKQLSRKDFTDLLEFLTAKGKYLPLALDKVATVVSTRGMFNREESRIERLVFADWKPKAFEGVPFYLVDPQGARGPNVLMLYGPNGAIPPKMPKAVSLPCNVPAKMIHLLSGVSGWGYPASSKGTISMIVRLHYAGGTTEDHPLTNGEQFADYIRRVDVPGSKFAFDLNGRQVRYLAIEPKRRDVIERIEFVKGPDDTAPVVMAVTLETLE
jgi:putative membrane-bound dehydrogenase-like protein